MDEPQTTLAQASDASSDFAAEVAARRSELGVQHFDAIADVFGDIFARFRQPPPGMTAERLAERDRELAAESARELAREQRRRLDALLGAAGERYRDCTFDSWRFTDNPKFADYQRRAVAEIRKHSAAMLQGEAGGLVLYGPVGTGKDHLAVAVAAEQAKAGRSVRFINGQDWFGSIRDAMDDERDSEAAIVDKVARYDLAIISDPLPPIGALSQHQATMLYRAVQARYASGRPTIVTVNVANDAEADSRLGAPTWDRINHGALMVLCQWPSYRKPARKIAP